MSNLEDANLYYLEKHEDVEFFFQWLGQRRPVLCLDTETTGLRYWRPDFKVRLIQFGDSETGFVMRADRFGAVAEEVLSSYTGRWTGHNAFAFDYHALTAAGFSFPDRRLMDDTLPMSKIAQAWDHQHGLKYQGVKHFGDVAGQGQDMLDDAFEAHGLRTGRGASQEQSEHAWSTIPYNCEAYYLYSGMDTVLGARLWEKLRPVVDSTFAAPYAREMGSWAVTVDHEHKGMRVDLPYAEQLYDEMTRDINVTVTQLAELGVANPGSRKKLAEKLIDEGWVPQEYNKKSGAPKLDKAVLEGLDHEVVGPLLEYSRLTKWRKAYVENIVNNAQNGRVYPFVSNMGAKTGRQSMSNPPIHQMPSRHPDAWKIRRMFLAEEGESVVSIDYAAQEDRLSTHFSNDQAYRDIFANGYDKHRYTAAGVYQKPYEQVTDSERSLIKNYSYAAAYGAQDPKLAKMLGIAVGDVAAIRDRTSSVYVGFAEYVKRLEQMGRDQFFSEGKAYATTIGGRRVYADQGRYGEPKYYTLVNYVNQGSGGDILKETQNRLAAAGLSHHLMMELHDEVLISVPTGPEGAEIAREVGKIMEYRTGDESLGQRLTIDMLTSVGEQSPYWSGH